MRKAVWAAAIVAGCVLVRPAVAGHLIAVPPVPGSEITDVSAINDSNVIVGSYLLPNDYYWHSFVGKLDGHYTTFDYPTGSDGIDTRAEAIDNNGDVGGYAEVHSTGRDYSFVRHPDGSFTKITRNGRIPSVALEGLSSDGQAFVGVQSGLSPNGPRSFVGHGDVYDGVLKLPFKNVFAPWAGGINSYGDIAGYYESCDGCSVHGHAFLIHNGIASRVDLPSPPVGITELYAINDNGVATGEGVEQTDPNYAYEYPFIYDSNTKVFTLLKGIFPRGINNAGLAAVDYSGQPYIYCPGTKRQCAKVGTMAMSIAETRISASPNAQAILCSHACRRPLAKRN